MNAPHVYVRAWMLCCLNLSKGTDNVGGQLCGDRERPYSGATSSGRVWRKVLESDAQSVGLTNTLNAAMSCHNCTKQNVALQMLEDHDSTHQNGRGRGQEG